MSFVFVSHAAPDKRDRVRPLAMALALDGVQLWLDRPGPGADDFQLPEDFIRRYGIRGIPLGTAWDDGVRQALRDAGAVLVCLSAAALEPGRDVLRQEMLLAQESGKNVVCIVDGLDPQKMPAEQGLLRLGRAQALRVDPAALAQAVAWLLAEDGRTPAQLPAPLDAPWQVVRRLRSALDEAAHAARSPAPAPTGSARVAGLLALLALHPVAPPVLQRLYWRSLTQPGRQVQLVSLQALLADLDNLPPRRALYPSPLIEFAERLAQETGQGAFSAWVDAQTQAEPSARLALRALLQAETGRAPPPATLFIDVDPPQGCIRWWVQAADRRLDGERRSQAFSGAPAEALAASLPAALRDAADWLARTHTQRPALAPGAAPVSALPASRLRVALLLPRDLLASGLEALPVAIDEGSDIGVTTQPLCRRYPVTLHWRTRASPAMQALGGGVLAQWLDTLDALQPRLAGGGGAGVLWAGDADSLDDTVNRLLDPGSAEICVGLGPRGATLEADIKACTQQGLPFFFWFGRAPPAGSADLQQHVCGEFSRHTPAMAPLQVAMRRLRERPDGAFGTLAVVWDEPGHLPPDDLNHDPSEADPP